MEQQTSNGPLLRVIFDDQLPSTIKAFRLARPQLDFPFFRLLREPSHLNEFYWTQFGNLAIWRENETVICVGHGAFKTFSERHVICWVGYERGILLPCSIVGKTDAAIAETATFFWSLQHSGNRNTLDIFRRAFHSEHQFDLNAITPEQLARILDANPKRSFTLREGNWNTAQTIILATRPYPLELTLTGADFVIEDDGTAFVDALEKRQSSFGSLDIDFRRGKMPLSSENLKRLLNLDVFEKLSSSFLHKECVFLPFYTKVTTALDCRLDTEYMQSKDFENLDVFTKDLTVRIDLEDAEGWDVFLPCLNRMAELGHFERLCIELGECWERREADAAPLVEALIGAINGNTKLKYLDLSCIDWYLDWSPHLEHVFQGMEDHKGLRKVIVRTFPPESDSDADYDDSEDDSSEVSQQADYSWLERLLSRNRNITVLDRNGETITNGTTIDQLYFQNFAYNRTTNLTKESISVRPTLVAMALAGSASADFSETGLLLSFHTDMLCELLNDNDADF